MNWLLAHRYSPSAAALADRHYSRQKPGAPQFSPPGRLIVLVTACGRAAWTAVHQRHVRRRVFRGAWNNALFRREPGAPLASTLIREACAAARALWGDPPSDGLITFVDPSQIRPKRDPGRCYLRAGFRDTKERTGSGLLVLRLAPEDFPAPELPVGAQLALGVA